MHSNVEITLRFMGRTLNLEGYMNNICEVLVIQQHCGGNTLVLFKGIVAPKGKRECLIS